MIIIDTDHFSELQRQSRAGLRLRNRLNDWSDQGIATTIITAEEQLRGQLAVLKRLKSGGEEVSGYQRLSELLAFFEGWTILRFDRPAALVFAGFATPMVQRVGPMDCKIAAIGLSTSARPHRRRLAARRSSHLNMTNRLSAGNLKWNVHDSLPQGGGPLHPFPTVHVQGACATHRRDDYQRQGRHA